MSVDVPWMWIELLYIGFASFTMCPSLSLSFFGYFLFSSLPPQVDQSTPLVRLFARAPAGECREGELGEAIKYLKKSQYLALPLDWADVLWGCGSRV